MDAIKIEQAIFNKGVHFSTKNEYTKLMTAKPQPKTMNECPSNFSPSESKNSVEKRYTENNIE